MRRLLYFYCLVAFLLAAPKAFAVSMSVTSVPATVDQHQEFFVNITLLCPSCGDSYIRAVFYPSGTNYFGFTKNNDGAWINASGGSCSQYFKLTTTDFTEGSWSGILAVKPDITHVAYAGPGEYLFKVGRYSAGCSATWSQETTITISGPTITPTPTPQATTIPTATATPPQPTLRPEETSTPTPTTTPTAWVIIPSATEAPVVILGETVEVPSPVSSDTATINERALRPFAVSLLFIGGGTALLSLALLWQKRSLWTHRLEKIDC